MHMHVHTPGSCSASAQGFHVGSDSNMKVERPYARGPQMM